MSLINLQTIFDQHVDRGSGKWKHYIAIYERYFEKYRGKEVHILEIGISGGGSLQIWKKYFTVRFKDNGSRKRRSKYV